MNETKIKLNEYISLTVQTPEETDIATYDGITELVRRINKAVGTMINIRTPTRVYNKKGKWNEETATAFIKDSYVMLSEEVLKKYDLTTDEVNPKIYIQKRRTYLRVKFNIKDERARKTGPTPPMQPIQKQIREKWSVEQEENLKICKKNHNTYEQMTEKLNKTPDQIKSKIGNMKSRGQW